MSVLSALEKAEYALQIVRCIQRAAEKLRAQNSLCNKIRIRIRTWMFNSNEPKYANGTLVELPHFANDVRLMTKGATEAVNRLSRPGYKYSKAEVLLLDLRQLGEFTDDLFVASQPLAAEELMSVLDEINTRWEGEPLGQEACLRILSGLFVVT